MMVALTTVAISDPSLANVTNQAEARGVIRLPWFTREVRLGTFFDSSLVQSDNPFLSIESGPFNKQTLQNASIRFSKSGNVATYKSCETTASFASTEHLSLALGVSVGCCILRATVSGHYDRIVMENDDDTKTSIQSTYRSGTIRFLTPPKLSNDALRILKHYGGLSAFKKSYGDYYVAGLDIGADAGMMMSTSTCTKTEKEALAIQAKVKVLFSTIRKRQSVDWSKFEVDARFNIAGFYTLESLVLKESIVGARPPFDEKVEEAMAVIDKMENVSLEVEKILEGLGVKQGVGLTHTVCEELCKAGVVAELFLLPVETLREVQIWSCYGTK